MGESPINQDSLADTIFQAGNKSELVKLKVLIGGCKTGMGLKLLIDFIDELPVDRPSTYVDIQVSSPSGEEIPLIILVMFKTISQCAICVIDVLELGQLTILARGTCNKNLRTIFEAPYPQSLLRLSPPLQAPLWLLSCPAGRGAGPILDANL
jgi:hypothetical protein